MDTQTQQPVSSPTIPQQSSGASSASGVPQGLDPTAFYLSKSIRSAERDPSQSDMYSQRGKSGEYGAFQYMPSTWNTWSQKYLGQSVPLEQSTPDQQNQVAYSRVKELLDQGHTQSEIASNWNSGDFGAKDGTFTLGSRKGNPSSAVSPSTGVAYDVPGYVNKVQKYYSQYASGIQQPIEPQTPVKPEPQNPNVSSGTTSEGSPQSFLNEEKGLLGKIWKEASGKQDLASPFVGAGAVANAAINTPVKHAVGAVNSILKKIPVVAGLENDFNKGIGKILNTPLGQSLVRHTKDFQQRNPRLSEALEGGTNMVSAGLTLAALASAGGAIKDAVSSGLARHATEGISKTLMANGYSQAEAETIANTLVQTGANPLAGMVNQTLNTHIAQNVLSHALENAGSETAKSEILSAMQALGEINGQAVSRGFLGSAASAAGGILRGGVRNALRFGLPLAGAYEGVRSGLFNVGQSSPK